MFNIFGNNKFENYQQRKLDRMLFEINVDTKIFEGVIRNKLTSKYLSTYDRYLLEFRWLDKDFKEDYSLPTNVIIYDENLNIVYDAQFKTFKALNSNKANSKGQMLLELEYWLSHDWKKD